VGRILEIAILGALSACSSTGLERLLTMDVVVADTTGAEFVVRCDEIVCDVEPRGPKIRGDCIDAYAIAADRFIRIYAGLRQPDGVVSIYPQLTRLVACDTRDCPKYEHHNYECRNGLCQETNAGAGFDYYDAVAMCLDKRPRPDDCADIDNADAIATFQPARMSCPYNPDPNCRLAPECRQP
jgi:hypothetical protein